VCTYVQSKLVVDDADAKVLVVLGEKSNPISLFWNRYSIFLLSNRGDDPDSSPRGNPNERDKQSKNTPIEINITG
jgi:hypothetical protein